MFNDIDPLLSQEIATNRALLCLLERIIRERDPQDTREALQRITMEPDPEAALWIDALGYYSGMRAALGEEDFRWLRLADGPVIDAKKLRRRRVAQYQRHRELFELEMLLVRKVQRAGMALSGNWSHLWPYLLGSAAIVKACWMLRAAEKLYWLGMPGALDLCDAGAFEMFRLVYSVA